MPIQQMLLTGGKKAAGQQEFTSNTSWTVPAGVTSISIVAIGSGGALSLIHI